VANRGEIAIRAFRAAYELGIATVAVYPYEDRNSPHRLADEAYQIGEVGHPVRAYLSVDEIVATARRAGADAIYPGYGFLICVGDPRKGGILGRFRVCWPHFGPCMGRWTAVGVEVERPQRSADERPRGRRGSAAY